MKKNIKKALLVFAIAALTIGGGVTATYAVESYQTEKTERAYLLDFIHYCQGNEGLEQMNDTIDAKKSSMVDLKRYAMFFLEQDNYADVSDYWDVRVIEGIVYPKVDGRVIYNN